MIGGAVLALTVVVPINPAGADQIVANDDGGSQPVVESETGSYIVVMKADPLVASIAPDDLDSAAAQAQSDVLDGTHDDVLTDAGVSTEAKVQDYTNAVNGFSAVIGYDQAVEISKDPKVAVVLPDELRQITSTSSASDNSGRSEDDLGNFLGLTGRGRAWASGLTGEGVIVGVIDTGIWPEHPSFADNGTYPAHDALDDSRPNCEFGNTAKNPNDKPFTCNNKLIGARQMLDTYRSLTGGFEPDEFDSARDDDGHGTHTASTAAGNANVQAVISGRRIAKVSGIAPRAQIIAYKALGNNGGYSSDLAAAIDQAVADGVDVINYSVGGGANLLNIDAIAFLFAADADVFVAVSAGNDGPGPETIGGPSDSPWVTSVGANTQRRLFQGTIRLDNGRSFKGASVTRGTRNLALVDAATAGTSDLCLANTLDPTKVQGKIVLCRRGGNGRVAKSQEVLRAGGAGMILYNTTDTDNLFSDNFFVPTVHVDNSVGVKIKQYIASTRRPKAQIDDTAEISNINYSPSMTIFSSRGPSPTSADIIKPDITAPGLQILAGASPIVGADEVQGELFQAIAGTSMSSPVVAGVYALVKQAHPDWTSAMAKSALMVTANTKVADNDRVSQAGPFAMGSGMVDPGVVGAAGSIFNPGLVYDVGFDQYLGFMCEAAPDIFANPTASCAARVARGVPTTAQNLNYPSIAVQDIAGVETITRTVTSVASNTVTFKASVHAPAGYTAVVSPSSLTLAPGASASYTVTFTNVSATTGEWRFGDLTWKGRGYEVRSPIAVKGVQLAAPAEVAGSGAAGSATFDVKFGYTGAYTAAAHGLVAATASDGLVVQDPDQAPFTSDDGDGLITFDFTVTDTAVARWALSIPGPDDLDLYLFNSAGDLVAQSTNGGTDELIELQLPANDTYTMAVHGWLVNDPAGLAFALQSWMVPVATGGSLSVSGPAAAVSGQTASITASWAGLTPGSYLGAVSHSDANGIVGLTVVAVDVAV
jgi:subtilisin family serine protease